MDVEVRQRGTLEELQSGVEDGDLEFGLLIPPGYDEALRGGRGRRSSSSWPGPEGMFAALSQGIETAVAEQSAQIRAARIAADLAEIDFAAALEGARNAQDALEGISVEEVTLGEATFPSIGNPFALGAQNQTVLFMFLTSMTAATQLLLTRQLGVSRRMLATPTPGPLHPARRAAGPLRHRHDAGPLHRRSPRRVLFGVRWGDLLGASMVIVVFALVGTGAAMVVGVFARNPDQAGSIGIVFGMILGALGGAMVPGELFDEPISTISMFTPHYWAIDAFRDLVFYEAACQRHPHPAGGAGRLRRRCSSASAPGACAARSPAADRPPRRPRRLRAAARQRQLVGDVAEVVEVVVVGPVVGAVGQVRQVGAEVLAEEHAEDVHAGVVGGHLVVEPGQVVGAQRAEADAVGLGRAVDAVDVAADERSLVAADDDDGLLVGGPVEQHLDELADAVVGEGQLLGEEVALAPVVDGRFLGRP